MNLTDGERDALRTATIIGVVFVLACMACFFLLLASGDGYVFADNTIHLSRAQGDELREFHERRLQADWMNQLEYRADKLLERIQKLWLAVKPPEARA